MLVVFPEVSADCGENSSAKPSKLIQQDSFYVGACLSKGIGNSRISI